MSSRSGCCDGGSQRVKNVQRGSTPKKAGIAGDKSGPASREETDKTSPGSCHSPEADTHAEGEHDCCCR